MMNQEQSVSESMGRTAITRDAIGLLTEDHRQAQSLLERLTVERLGSNRPDEKFQIAKQVCGDLLIHMAIEEAIFYPRVRDALQEDALVDGAEQEHDSAKELIRQIGEVDPADPLFDMKMEDLAQEILAHVEEEESIVFPKMLLAQTDLLALGDELHRAKNLMRSNLGLPPQ